MEKFGHFTLPWRGGSARSVSLAFGGVGGGVVVGGGALGGPGCRRFPARPARRARGSRRAAPWRARAGAAVRAVGAGGRVCAPFRAPSVAWPSARLRVALLLTRLPPRRYARRPSSWR